MSTERANAKHVAVSTSWGPRTSADTIQMAEPAARFARFGKHQKLIRGVDDRFRNGVSTSVMLASELPTAAG